MTEQGSNKMRNSFKLQYRGAGWYTFVYRIEGRRLTVWYTSNAVFVEDRDSYLLWADWFTLEVFKTFEIDCDIEEIASRYHGSGSKPYGDVPVLELR